MSKRLVGIAGVVLLAGAALFALTRGPDTVLGSYDVEDGELAGDPPPSHEATWDRLNEIFAPDTHPDITGFAALDAEAGGGADGFVSPLTDDLKQWTIGLDVTNAYGPESLDRTIIHEFGHLVSFRPSQIDVAVSAEDCEVFHTGDGCPRSGTYLDQYFRRFWDGYTREQWENEPENAAAERFATGDFHTEYAATSPTEDFAEAFAEWMLIDAIPTDDTVIYDKMRFFESFEPLVQLRFDAKPALANR